MYIINYNTVNYKLQLTGQPSHILLFQLLVWVNMMQLSMFLYRK